MIQIMGQVVNLFTVEAGVDKDGNNYPESYKVQLMGKMAMENGDSKMDLVDLKVDDLSEWKQYHGKKVVIEVGEFAPAKGRIIHYVRKGAKPKALQA